MSQLLAGGRPVCRWCKEPLDEAFTSATRPREVHPEHVRVRRNALGSDRWTRAMDDALTLEQARGLAAAARPATAPWAAPAARLQSVLNLCLAQGAEPPAPTVALLLSASAELLECLHRAS